MKRVFIMAHETARANAIQAVQNAPEGYTVTIAEPNRTLEQNALQWPILQAFADQLQWPVNGQMVWMTAGLTAKKSPSLEGLGLIHQRRRVEETNRAGYAIRRRWTASRLRSLAGACPRPN